MGKTNQSFQNITMKLIALSSLATMAIADMDSITTNFIAMAKANNASIEGVEGAMMRAAITGSDDDRLFVDPILSNLQPIFNYGCWCHFGADWVHAGGAVQDSIDTRCKQLINGYRCAKMDGADRGEDCDAGNVAYTTYNYFGGEPILSNCANSNVGNQCAIDACIIEGQFTMDFLVDIVSNNMGSKTNADFQGAPLGTWDRDVECVVTNAPGGTRECCGAHPTRAPFSVTKGIHDCCNGLNLFNIATHQCCDVTFDIKLVGDAC